MKLVLIALSLLLAASLLDGCTTATIPPPPVGTCTRDARLPKPPAPSQRTIPVLIRWANTAAAVANKAIDERDLCAGSYDRLNAWAISVSKGHTP
jgi:hypothetical protein